MQGCVHLATVLHLVGANGSDYMFHLSNDKSRQSHREKTASLILSRALFPKDWSGQNQDDCQIGQ